MSKLLKSQIKKMSELALIRGIPDLIVDDLKNGRLKGQCFKLVKEVDKQFLDFPSPDEMDISKISGILSSFGKSTGWENKPKHVMTLVSFCLDMVEKSENKNSKKLIDILNNIADYFERKKDANQSSFWSGQLAAEKWNALFF